MGLFRRERYGRRKNDRKFEEYMFCPYDCIFSLFICLLEHLVSDRSRIESLVFDKNMSFVKFCIYLIKKPHFMLM